MALWSIWRSANPLPVRMFRIGVAQLVLIIPAQLPFLRQKMVDEDRIRLLESSRESIEKLKHFQAQMIQTEKVVSLGQLAAGAAHEINNPLTGILGYLGMMMDDPSLGERHRVATEKALALARRIKTLVTIFLRFARRTPSEKSNLDLNHELSGALNLSNLGLREKGIEIEMAPHRSLPRIRGDGNQILSVFFNWVSNAAEALEEVGGGKLLIRTLLEDSNAVVEFSDTGPGIQSPPLACDPFFTTEPVRNGAWLSLSICYGIVQEHGGAITCFNRSEGGATFVVKMPMINGTRG